MIELKSLRRVRMARFMSQAELSQKSGVTESAISRLEKGKERARFVTARKLAEALGVEPGELTRSDEDADEGKEAA